MSSKNIAVVLTAVILLFFGYYYLNSKTGSAVNLKTLLSLTPTVSPPPAKVSLSGNILKYTIVGSNYSFDIKEIKAKIGDKIELTFKNQEGFHDWVVDEFSARTKQLPADSEETIEFIADKAGTFEYYCSVGSHRKMGMVGKLIVE